jgi:hypothetical protein
VSKVTFRAKLTVTRLPTPPTRSWGLDLSAVPDMSTMVVHLDEDDPVSVHQAMAGEGTIGGLRQELQDPSGAVRYVNVTLEPAP